jgi:hypothetical protein
MYRRFSHTTEHDRVYVTEINETDCEVLQAYLSQRVLKNRAFLRMRQEAVLCCSCFLGPQSYHCQQYTTVLPVQLDHISTASWVQSFDEGAPDSSIPPAPPQRSFNCYWPEQSRHGRCRAASGIPSCESAFTVQLLPAKASIKEILSDTVHSQ